MPESRNRVWLNGRLLSPEDAAVPIAAHGVLYGDGLFETVRVYAGHPFRLDRHLERMLAGARVLGLDLVWGPQALATAVCDTVAGCGLREAAVRITALRGVGPPGPDIAECGEAIVFITARAYAGYAERIYREGARSVIASTLQSERSPLCHVKSVSYLNHVLARTEARQAGADEALLLNSRGELAEGSVSNVFARFGDRLVTPPPESGCLPGIARREVIELAPGLGLQVQETPLMLSEFLDADEALLTNSLMEVAPLVTVGAHAIGGGIPGKAAVDCREAYLGRVAESSAEA
jgi:branched-chain amino acid aminotransferase